MPSTPERRPAPDGRRERWRAHREARRGELIDAVVRAVQERGASIGMDDIAAASGIAKPVYYRYFADKADLFRAVGRQVAEAIVAEVTTAIDRESSPRDMLSAGIDAYVRAIESRPELYRFAVNSQYLGDPQSADPLGDYASVVGRHATRVIGDLLRSVGDDSGAAEPWGFGIVGMVRAATDRWLEEQSMSREALVGYLTDLAWPGMARAGRNAARRSKAATDTVPGRRLTAL